MTEKGGDAEACAKKKPISEQKTTRSNMQEEGWKEMIPRTQILVSSKRNFPVPESFLPVATILRVDLQSVLQLERGRNRTLKAK